MNLVIDKAGHLIQSDDRQIPLFYLEDSDEFVSNVAEMQKEYEGEEEQAGTKIRQFKGKNLSEMLAMANPEFQLNEASLRILDPKPGNILFIMYTSGTTGLPKAVPISHRKYLFTSLVLKNSLGLLPTDIVYSSLPLYHLLAGVLSTSTCILYGATLVLARRFQTNLFWHEVKKFNCTVSG